MKRILALDGGGIRGLFTLQVLGRIEEIFRAERQRPDLVLRDEFDLFAGTSTGAIIATCLAWGMSVGEVEQLYVSHAPAMFSLTPWYQRWKAKYRAEAIADVFRREFCEHDEARTPARLGTARFGAGDALKYVLIVTRNATTGSPWPVSNNPRAMYNDPAHPDCNLRIPLWQLLRASTAAPTYFAPEAIATASGTHLFVDGGMSAFNNPALIAVLTATLPCYRIEWPAGTDRLMLVSVGTGLQATRLTKHQAERVNWLDQAKYATPAVMAAVGQEQDLICRVIGDCRFGDPLDSELGNLSDSGLLSRPEKKFVYLRYNRSFDGEDVRTLDRSQRQFTLDNLALMPFLQRTGREYAAAAVSRGHFFG